MTHDDFPDRISFGPEFDGPVGLYDGIAREISGNIQVNQKQDGGYVVSSTRIPTTETLDLTTVILTSGEANIAIDDSVESSEPVLTVQRVSGFTNLRCGNNTIVEVGRHSGKNKLVGCEVLNTDNSPSFTIIVPADKLKLAAKGDFSWINKKIRIEQVSGFVNITVGNPEGTTESVAEVTGQGLGFIATQNDGWPTDVEYRQLPVETDDDAVLRMLGGATFGPGAKLILPSGVVLGGDEAQAFTTAFGSGQPPQHSHEPIPAAGINQEHKGYEPPIHKVGEDRTISPLDSRFDNWTGNPEIDRAELVRRAKQAIAMSTGIETPDNPNPIRKRRWFKRK